MVSSKFEGKSFQRTQTVKMIFIKDGTIPKSYNLNNLDCTFFSYLYFSLAGNIIFYTPNQGTNREKYFSHTIYQRKDADSRGKQKHTSIHFFLHGPRVFHLSTEKSTNPIRRKWTSNSLFPCQKKIKTETRIKDISIQGKNSRIQWKDNLKYGKKMFIKIKDS